METSDRLGAFRLALILALISAIVAVIPSLGGIMWYVGVPAAILVLILAVVTIVRGRAKWGFFLIFCAFAVPAWCWFAPFLTSGKVAAWIHGQPETPAAAADSSASKPPSPEKAGAEAPPVESRSTDVLPPVEPIEERAPMFAMREWTSSDGRKMRAELSHVFRNDDGLFTGHFVRDDGKSFDMPVGKLSPEDLDAVKKAMAADPSGVE